MYIQPRVVHQTEQTAEQTAAVAVAEAAAAAAAAAASAAVASAAATLGSFVGMEPIEYNRRVLTSTAYNGNAISRQWGRERERDFHVYRPVFGRSEEGPFYDIMCFRFNCLSRSIHIQSPNDSIAIANSLQSSSIEFLKKKTFLKIFLHIQFIRKR